MQISDNKNMLVKLSLEIIIINSYLSDIKQERIKKFLNALSASETNLPISYLFFLEPNGRYIADTFLIEHANNVLLISESTIMQRLIAHLKKYDLKKEFCFEKTNLNIYYTPCETNTYKDPRMDNSFFVITQEAIECTTSTIYAKTIIQNEIAEFTNFEENKSIIPEFGKISKFISLNKGCYPGQELMQRVASMGQIRKTVKKTKSDDDSIIRILKSLDNDVLALKRL